MSYTVKKGDLCVIGTKRSSTYVHGKTVRYTDYMFARVDSTDRARKMVKSFTNAKIVGTVGEAVDPSRHEVYTIDPDKQAATRAAVGTLTWDSNRFSDAATARDLVRSFIQVEA